MKKYIQRLSNEELKKYPLDNLIKGWFFKVDEISQGYYRVEGIDQWGRSVSRDGIDPDKLIDECKKDILEMLSDE